MRQAAALLFLALLGSGCATTLRVEVRTTKETNEGRPLYMLVRRAEGASLVAETYETAAARVFSHPADDTVERVQPIMPGETVRLSVPRPSEGDLAVYFFFTRPGSRWRFPLSQPIPSDMIIELGEHEVERVQVRKR